MSSSINRESSVGALVAENIARSRVFEKYGIDYCCGGDTPFVEACATKGLDADAVAAELAESDVARNSADADYRAMPMSRLCDEIEATHHVYMKRELPRLTELFQKTCAAHAENHPELVQAAQVFQGLKLEIEGHLMKEEQVLFPMIRQIEVAAEPPRFHCGSMSAPVSVMELEHDNAGAALAKLRKLTSDYTPPADACNTYGAMLAGLAEMEFDLHQHIHKENNILFPRALEAEVDLYGWE